MLFKLSLKNIKKSFKDYAIYFLTLVLGIAIFYMFNSLDSQQAMLQVSQSTKDIITLMINMLGLVSVFVAVILALLIVYANNFIVNRRKKEFGIYMTLGMGKRQISKIILLETIFIGIISLAVGILVGVLGAQFMSILVAKLFEADMSEFTFVFSKTACIKTCVYFAIMYLVVIIFNTITISKYKLINLLTANKKNETVKIKNPIICIIVFLISIVILAYDYYKVTGGVKTLSTVDKLTPIILSGIVATILFFWSLSGFILKIVQTRKKVYYKDANMFVLRQLNNKIKLKSLYDEAYLELSPLKRKFVVPLEVLLLKKKIYKKYIKDNYDVEIAFLEGPITRLFSVKNKKTDKIVWIHNDISKVFGRGVKAKVKKCIDKKHI